MAIHRLVTKRAFELENTLFSQINDGISVQASHIYRRQKIFPSFRRKLKYDLDLN